jgi:uncharacterized membrane protein
MTDQDFSPAALRAALAAADRDMHRAWAMWAFAGVVMAGVYSLLQRALDWSQPTHRVIVLTGLGTAALILFSLFNLQLRQNAANARLLRAMELLHQRLQDSQRPLRDG